MSRDDREPESRRYVRFVCALALAGALGASGCAQVAERIGCEHCICPWDTRSLSRPVSCDLLGLDYCCTPVMGPLSPPDVPL